MANVTDSIRNVEDKLDAQLAKANRAQTMTLIGGIIIIAILLAYFGFMSKYTREMSEPKELTNWAMQTLKPKVGTLSEEADRFVKNDAPGMLRNMINDGINTHIPEGRKELEKGIVEHATKALDNFEKEINAAVADTTNKYSTNIAEFAQLLRTEEGTEEVKDRLFKVIDESVTEDGMKSELESYGSALASVEDHINRLTGPAEALSDDDKALFHLVAVIRELSNRSELNKVSGVSLDLGKDSGADTVSEEPEPAAKKAAPKANAKPAAKAAPKAAEKKPAAK